MLLFRQNDLKLVSQKCQKPLNACCVIHFERKRNRIFTAIVNAVDSCSWCCRAFGFFYGTVQVNDAMQYIVSMEKSIQSE